MFDEWRVHANEVRNLNNEKSKQSRKDKTQFVPMKSMTWVEFKNMNRQLQSSDKNDNFTNWLDKYQ